MLRPVVVLDEAHKAYGAKKHPEDFVRSVNRLDPRLVIELRPTVASATCVDISGVELKTEEMIKLPVSGVVHHRMEVHTPATSLSALMPRHSRSR